MSLLHPIGETSQEPQNVQLQKIRSIYVTPEMPMWKTLITDDIYVRKRLSKKVITFKCILFGVYLLAKDN